MTTARSQSGSSDAVALIVGAICSLGLLAACGVGCLWYREATWPWTDRNPSHGWFHCVNETAMPVAWGWRYKGLDGWNYVGSIWSKQDAPVPGSWTAEGESDAILPGCIGEVVEVKIQFPAESGLPAIPTSFVVSSGLHVHLRVARDHRAFVALGSATDIGYVTFGPERQIGGP